MFGRKTRDLIVETATIVKGLKTDFKSHEEAEDAKIDNLYLFVDKKVDSIHQTIKDCHESCPETDRFNQYTQAQNGTLLRIEKKYDTYHVAAKLSASNLKADLGKRQDDYLKKLDGVKEEVKAMREAKKTKRQVWADIGKVVGYTCIVAALLFGIMRYYDGKKAAENKKIEMLLEKLVDKSAEG